MAQAVGRVSELTSWLEMSGSDPTGRRFLIHPKRTLCFLVEVGGLSARSIEDEAAAVVLQDSGSYVLVLFPRREVNGVMFVGPRAKALAQRFHSQVLTRRGATATLKHRGGLDTRDWSPTILGTTLTTGLRFRLFVAAKRFAGLRSRLAARGNRFAFAKATLEVATTDESKPRFRRQPRGVWKIRYVRVPGYAGHLLVRAVDKKEALEISRCDVDAVAVSRTREPTTNTLPKIITRNVQVAALPRSTPSDAGRRYPARYENMKGPRRDPVTAGRRKGPLAQHRRRKD
jgi:hypothetical protein